MNKQNLETILAYFDEILPNAKTELIYNKPYELLIAVVLSAQTTDVAVNQVTKKLFAKFTTLKALSNASYEQVAAILKTLGLYQTKSKHVLTIAKMLLEKFEGQVPCEKEQLLTLPGVGIKTANVVRAELFNIPEIAVDTHVTRVSKRLKFAKFSDNVTIIEAKLRKILPMDRYIKTHHQMIHFGRYFCLARSPKCYDCPLVNICAEPNKNLIKK